MEKPLSPPPIRRKPRRPQQEWKEIIALYLYLAGMGAGSFLVGLLIHWAGTPLNPLSTPSFELLGIPVDLTKLPILWGPIMVSIGAPFLILDLGIKWRFMYACLNPRTSWVARGFIILSVFIVFGLFVLIRALLPADWLKGTSPLWRIPEAIAFVFAFWTALYTGILLKATKSVPLWNTPLLPLLFFTSALSTGTMAIILSLLGTGSLSYASPAMKILMYGEQIFIVIEGIVLYLFLSRRYRSSEQGKDSVHLLVRGDFRYLFWGGIILLGFIFPVLLEWLSKAFQSPAVLWMAGLSLLTGGFFLRLGLIRAGVKEQIPMQRWLEFQHGLIPSLKFGPAIRSNSSPQEIKSSKPL
ncbi:MAG: polysulfide reductase NrfD [Desulfobacterota bacterium]|nr:polysulfide reductase NrfD [Thermodesulfobacteriota bacterium]